MASRFDSILNKIQKDYSVEIDDAENICRVERIVTDSPGVNYVFGGGIPKGRIILLHGPYSSGKTSLSNFLCAQVQKYGGDKNKVLYMDFEYSWDPEFAASFNLKIKKDDGFYLLRPENGEDAFEIIRQFVESGEVGMVVIDSASTISSRSQNEDPNKPGFGPAAKVMANGLRYINPFLARNKCTLIIIGQERANIGCVDKNTEVKWTNHTSNSCTTISEMFREAFGLDDSKMKVNHPYYVGEANIEILSRDDKGNNVFSKVLYAVKKSKRDMYKLTTLSGKNVRVAKNHLFAIRKDNSFEWMLASDIYKHRNEDIEVLTEEGVELVTEIEKDGKDNPLDIEVENTNNYFSNSILSHNSMYGPDFKASFAGTSPEFYSSITCRVTRTEDIKGKDELAGIVVKIRDIKNKVGTPKRESFINLYFDRGIDGDEEYGNFIVKLLCERKGAWYNNESWGMHVQGQNGVLEFLKEHPDIYETAKGLVNRALCSKKTLMGEDTSAAADYADSPAAPTVEEAWEAYTEE